MTAPSPAMEFYLLLERLALDADRSDKDELGDLIRDAMDGAWGHLSNDEQAALNSRSVAQGPWSSEWPTEPGWYWTWRPAARESCYEWLEPARVYWAGAADRRFLCFVAAGRFLHKQECSGLLWGSRIIAPITPAQESEL